MGFQIKLDIFEGPLDLLLHLIEQEEIDIYDIPIARITWSYLEYLRLMEELDLEAAGEYLVMAATLVYIKSRMLLPSHAGEGVDVPLKEDPRVPLVERLIEYKKYKEAATLFQEREIEQQKIFHRQEETGSPSPFPLEASLFDLITAFREVLQRTYHKPSFKVIKDKIRLDEKIQELKGHLKKRSPLAFFSLFPLETDKSELILTFLALLELIRNGLILARQARPFGEIMIYRRTGRCRAQISKGFKSWISTNERPGTSY